LYRYLKTLLKLWRARWCKVKTRLLQLSSASIILSQSSQTSANPELTCMHCHRQASTWTHHTGSCKVALVASQIPCPLQTDSHHFQRSHHTTVKLPGRTAKRTSSRSPVRKLPTATFTKKQTEFHRLCLQPRSTDHLEWTSYLRYFLKYTGTFQTVAQNWTVQLCIWQKLTCDLPPFWFFLVNELYNNNNNNTVISCDWSVLIFNKFTAENKTSVTKAAPSTHFNK